MLHPIMRRVQLFYIIDQFITLRKYADPQLPSPSLLFLSLRGLTSSLPLSVCLSVFAMSLYYHFHRDRDNSHYTQFNQIK